MLTDTSHRVLPYTRPDDLRLIVPPRPAVARRAGLPLLASLVPVIGAVGFFFVLQSPLVLWFALLGPVIAIATLLDGRRGAKRARRESDQVRSAVRADIEAQIARRHEAERDTSRMRHPDVFGYLDRPREIWRTVAGREGALRVGSGDATSGVRIEGEDADPLVQVLRNNAERVRDAPLVLPAHAGVAIVGPPTIAAAVARALVTQLCLSHAPGQLRIRTSPEHPWAADLPHVRAAAATCLLDARALVDRDPGDVPVIVVAPGAVVPPACAAVLTLTGPTTARLDYAEHSIGVRFEALSEAQAGAVAHMLSQRATEIGGAGLLPDQVAFAELSEEPSGTLAVAIGKDASGEVSVDLVRDGPHAIVTGMTGSGKSELLTTWVARLCANYATTDVSLLLADFKGGTAFDALAHLPHVTGVITDLDDAGAARALESLRAEIRHRESVIARSGARDIDGDGVALPRLVIVVDELAALLDGHPELASVFSDVAARGRALGVHLVLGTQRATGVIRDALMSNCPLRVSLRTVDSADSRYVIGTDAAAMLQGDPSSRGLALVRRAGDTGPTLLRVARTRPSDLASIATRRAREAVPRRPWQPELPRELRVDDVVFEGSPRSAGPVLGRADEPAQQRHTTIHLAADTAGLLVVGGPGSGKSGVLDLLEAQCDPRVVRRLSSKPEDFWDTVCALADGSIGAGEIVLADDVDAALASLPPDYAAAAVDMLEMLCRGARGRGICMVLTTARFSGPIMRVGELLPRRLILRVGSKIDHVAAGGDAAGFSPAAPAGRGQLDGVTVQIARASAPAPREADPERIWRPQRNTVGIVARPGAAMRLLQQALITQGAEVVELSSAAERGFGESAPASPMIIVGDPDEWQRTWRVLQFVRARGELVVDAACQLEYRLLTGDRSLPPYCQPGLGRAWALIDGGGPVRVVLPGQAHSARRRVA